MRSAKCLGWECSPTHFLSCWLSRLGADIWDSKSHKWRMTELSSQPGTTGLWDVGEGEKPLSWFEVDQYRKQKPLLRAERDWIHKIRGGKRTKNYSQNVTKMILHGKHCCHYLVQYTATLPQRTANANGQKANASLSLTYTLSGKAPHTPSRRPWSRDATPAERGVQQLNTVGSVTAAETIY